MPFTLFNYLHERAFKCLKLFIMKTNYEKPEVLVVKMELEQCILEGSLDPGIEE